MNISQYNLSNIPIPDNISAPYLSDEKEEQVFCSQSDLPDLQDLHSTFVEESELKQEFELLNPSRYAKDSFHVGQLVRYADEDKDIWY